jgi:hypothetical protein
VFIWEKKLKLTKKAIKSWAKSFSLPSHLEVLEKQKNLETIHESLDTEEVQPALLQKEQTTHKEYIRALRDEETIWRIKSRSL